MRFFYLILLITTSSIFISHASGCAMQKAYQKNPKQVGEIVPCSSRVGIKLTEQIKKDQSPKRIIEVGAGSGAITPKILAKMSAEDQLDLIEIEPLLCDVLKEKFGHQKNVSIHCMDFLAFKPASAYDYVISTLPLNSFPPDLVQKLTDHLVHVSKDGAFLSFVELKYLSALRKMVMKKAEKAEFNETRAIIEKFQKKYLTYETDVYLNFPPIIISHLKIDKR
jgi:phosphatidylethanolamine/phosphatidyl-N-methylethanolamine N-methyltransferase